MRYVRDGANKDRITQNLRPASEADPCGQLDASSRASGSVARGYRASPLQSTSPPRGRGQSTASDARAFRAKAQLGRLLSWALLGRGLNGTRTAQPLSYWLFAWPRVASLCPLLAQSEHHDPAKPCPLLTQSGHTTVRICIGKSVEAKRNLYKFRQRD